MTDLYSPSLDARYKASVGIGSRETSEYWPIGCGGAGNAFLVLVGPSMGRSTGALPAKKQRRLGPRSMNFDWGDHRKVRWTKLCAEILGNEERAEALTALLNLNAQHSTNEVTISDDEMRIGWLEEVRPLLSEIRPRIVCALTNRVWQTIVTALPGEPQEIEDCPYDLARKPVGFRISDCSFTTFVVKPHNHPSRFLSNQQIGELGRACNWLIKEVA